MFAFDLFQNGGRVLPALGSDQQVCPQQGQVGRLRMGQGQSVRQFECASGFAQGLQGVQPLHLHRPGEFTPLFLCVHCGGRFAMLLSGRQIEDALLEEVLLGQAIFAPGGLLAQPLLCFQRGGRARMFTRDLPQDFGRVLPLVLLDQQRSAQKRQLGVCGVSGSQFVGAVQRTAPLAQGLPGIDALPFHRERQVPLLFQLIDGSDDFAVTLLPRQFKDSLPSLLFGDRLEASRGLVGCGSVGVFPLNLSPDGDGIGTASDLRQ